MDVTMGTGSGQMFIHYDMDLQIFYLVGKVS